VQLVLSPNERERLLSVISQTREVLRQAIYQADQKQISEVEEEEIIVQKAFFAALYFPTE
jgi:hypothetical protein